MATPRYLPFFDDPEQRDRYRFTWLADDAVERVFEFDERTEDILAAKRRIMAEDPRALWSDELAFAADARATVRDVVLERLRVEHPARFPCQTDPPPTLDALALSIPPDLAVVSLRDTQDRLVYLHVSFPSGWDPAEHSGRNFAQVHARVPIVKKHLRDGDVRLRQILDDDRPRARFTWGLQTHDALDLHPRRHPRTPFDPTSGLWLRVERQVFLPAPAAGCVVFLIQPFVDPVSSLDRPQLDSLVAALSTMSDRDRAYKGIAADFDAIVESLVALRNGR